MLDPHMQKGIMRSHDANHINDWYNFVSYEKYVYSIEYILMFTYQWLSICMLLRPLAK